MQIARFSRRSFLSLGLLWLVAIPIAFSGQQTANEDLLAWKLQQGQRWQWSIEQTMQLTAPQDGKKTQATFKQLTDFDVEVTSVKKEITTLAISVLRIRVQTDQPEGKLSYDSAAVKAENSPAAPNADVDRAAPGDGLGIDVVKVGNDFLAAAVEPLRELKFSVAIDQQGTVQSVLVDGKALQPFEAIDHSRSSKALFEKVGFSSTYLGGIRLPPANLPVNQKWNSKTTSFSTGPLGSLHIEHVLRRDGAVEIEGRRLQKCSADIRVDFDKTHSQLMKLGKQTGTGVWYFNSQRGRLQSSQWNLTAQLLFEIGKAEGEVKLEGKSQICERANRIPR